MILILLILLPMTRGSFIEQISGFVGEDVLLPCNCTDDLNDLVWQRETRIVNAHSETEIDASYINRTQLFLKINRNCSLLLLNISLEDAGVYTCYLIYKINDHLTTKPLHVNLKVTQKKINPGFNETQTGGKSDPAAASITVPILAVVGILVAVVLILIIRKRHRRNIDTDLTAQEHMLEKV